MTLGDRIVVMRDGFIQQVGTPQEVFNHPDNIFVAGFIGTPQINFFHGCKLIKKANKYSLVIQDKEVALSAKQNKALAEKEYEEMDVVVGVRPVHIDIKGNTFSGVIEVSEMMGSEVHLHINVSGDDIVAVVPTAGLDLDTVSLGKKISFSFDPDLCHIFDSKTEKNLI